MNLNVYINDGLSKQLDLLAKETGMKRNTLINDAIATFIEMHKKKVWPKSILEFKGLKDSKDLERFEDSRKELLEPKLDNFDLGK